MQSLNEKGPPHGGPSQVFTLELKPILAKVSA